MLNKIQILQKFLSDKLLGSEYQPGMEVQVNVQKGFGEEQKKGNYTDGDETWYNYRIDNVEYGKTKLGYDFTKHVEAIGVSGWNYEKQISHWVGFDFDSIIGHKEGLSEQEISNILEKSKEVPWTTIRKSKSGQGLHIIVPIENSPKVCSRKEHIQVARYILSQLSALLSFDFKSKVDCAGTILWIWHVNTRPNGLSLVKAATDCFSNFPSGWADSFKIDTKTRAVVADLRFTNLDAEHQRLIKYLNEKNHGWWNAELNMLVCHTHMLKKAHTELNLKGVFHTNATGKNCPSDWNCFGFPSGHGSWVFRRYGSPTEHVLWKKDKNDLWYCYFNRRPTISHIASIYNGRQNSSLEWIFDGATGANSVLHILSPNGSVSFPDWIGQRAIRLKTLKGNKLAVIFERTTVDPGEAPGWIKRKQSWEQVVETYEEEKTIKPPDETIRHVVSEGESAGWFIRNNDGDWVRYETGDVKTTMLSLGYKQGDINEILGQCILNPWYLVNIPFGEEYPGHRRWNKYATKLKYVPSEGKFTHWQIILGHIGKNLDTSNNTWCVVNEINTGGHYLLMWLAAMFQYPTEPLPYLFLYGAPNCGKSILYEAVELLVNKGVVRGESALTSQSRHNEELAGAILAVIDEFNLAKNENAYDRIKDWVTARNISIRAMFRKPFMFPNTTHWLQIANDQAFCPIQVGDVRITVVHVGKPEIEIPKSELMKSLMDEAPGFLYALFNTKVPAPVGRLRIPVIESETKFEYAKTTKVEDFILSCMYPCQGHIVLFSDFCKRFYHWLGEQGISPGLWSARKIGASITESEKFPVKGRYGGEGQIYLGNFSFDSSDKPEMYKMIKTGDRIQKS